MSDTLPVFPVDDVMLDQLEHALGGSYTVDGNAVRLVGAEYSLSQLLDFVSGYDPAMVEPCRDSDGREIPDVFEYVGGSVYHPDDIIRALIAEVRRLRV